MMGYSSLIPRLIRRPDVAAHVGQATVESVHSWGSFDSFVGLSAISDPGRHRSWVTARPSGRVDTGLQSQSPEGRRPRLSPQIVEIWRPPLTVPRLARQAGCLPLAARRLNPQDAAI